MARLYSLHLLCSAVLSLAPFGCRHSRVADLPPEAIQAAFQSLITKVPASVYCLGYSTLEPDAKVFDPAPAIVARFHGLTSSVRVHSACEWRTMPPHGGERVVDRESGAPAMFLELLAPIRTMHDTIVVTGAYGCGTLCAGTGPVRMWRHANRWQARFDVELIS